MAQAWNIIGGYGGQVSFGHSVFFGIGAYGAGMAVVTYGRQPLARDPGRHAGGRRGRGAHQLPLLQARAATTSPSPPSPSWRSSTACSWSGTGWAGRWAWTTRSSRKGWRNLMWYDSKTGYYYCAPGPLRADLRHRAVHRAATASATTCGPCARARRRPSRSGSTARPSSSTAMALSAALAAPVRRLLRAVQLPRRPANGHVARHVDEVRAGHHPGRDRDARRAAARRRRC
ncbi:MAG: hypothetical protein MZV64_09600 [Ignavibacteriales bacterium]|nr:hypothetical protein [Ignavibacteriales bacterium]